MDHDFSWAIFLTSLGVSFIIIYVIPWAKWPENKKIKKMNDKKLSDLANKYHTDKLDHGYIPVYEKILPEDPRTILEIGVAFGASALMWADYFPNAEIHILDLFEDRDHVSPQWCKKNFFQVHKGDQSNLKVLADINEQFDFIIDDGSHRADHMIISFKHLFHNNLKSGGLYVIEDCHCCKDPFYNGDGYVKTFYDTALWMFREYMEYGEIKNPYFNAGEQAMFKNLIANVEITPDEKLILIWRV